jgi:pyruvate kinase
MTAARRPRQPIIAVSNDAMAARSFNLFWGARGVHVDVPFSKTSTDHVVKCLEELWRRGILDDDDLILVTALGYPRSGNRMNLLQTHAVSDLRKSLGWKK